MTADPRVVPEGRLLSSVSWDTMLELACCGAGVMHARAVDLARRRRIPFHVRSAFSRKDGTVVEGDAIESGPVVAAITGLPRVAEVRLSGLSLSPVARAAFFEALDALIEDLSGLHQYGEADRSHVAFHIAVNPEAEDVLSRLRELTERQGGRMNVSMDHAAVSVVGTGVLDAPAVAARAHRAMAEAGVSPASFQSGNLSLTFLVPHESYAAAQHALHREFLEAGAV